jgi:hypothetical protein
MEKILTIPLHHWEDAVERLVGYYVKQLGVGVETLPPSVRRAYNALEASN